MAEGRRWEVRHETTDTSGQRMHHVLMVRGPDGFLTEVGLIKGAEYAKAICSTMNEHDPGPEAASGG